MKREELSIDGLYILDKSLKNTREKEWADSTTMDMAGKPVRVLEFHRSVNEAVNVRSIVTGHTRYIHFEDLIKGAKYPRKKSNVFDTAKLDL